MFSMVYDGRNKKSLRPFFCQHCVFFAYWPDLTSSPMLKLKPVRDLTEDGFKAYSEDYLLKSQAANVRELYGFKAYSEDYLLK